jgi:hypothetical protein
MKHDRRAPPRDGTIPLMNFGLFEAAKYRNPESGILHQEYSYASRYYRT